MTRVDEAESAVCVLIYNTGYIADHCVLQLMADYKSQVWNNQG
jgi:hypothetical protein